MIFVFGNIASGQTAATLRQPRTLPLSAFQLNAVFAGLSLVTWLNAWIFLAVFHVVATGRPLESWQVPMFLAFFSLRVLARAINVHRQRSLVVRLRSSSSSRLLGRSQGARTCRQTCCYLQSPLWQCHPRSC